MEQTVTSDTEIVKLLKEQLENERQDKKDLLRLLDQQQQLTLVANKRLENLQLELNKNAEEEILDSEQKEEDKEVKDSLLYRIFKRNKV